MNRALVIIGGVLLTILIGGAAGLVGFSVGYILNLIVDGVNTMLLAYVFAGVALLAWLTYVVFFAAAALYANKKAKEFDEEFDRRWKGIR